VSVISRQIKLYIHSLIRTYPVRTEQLKRNHYMTLTSIAETNASIHSLGSILQPYKWLSKSSDSTQLMDRSLEKVFFFRWDLYDIHTNVAQLFSFAHMFKCNNLWLWVLYLQEYSLDVATWPDPRYIIVDYLYRYNNHFNTNNSIGKDTTIKIQYQSPLSFSKQWNTTYFNLYRMYIILLPI